ncbi:UDP-3-O-(3-hydroxymyristoyl)glucosamine N-acyltransferase [Acetohalobium arabaticum]|uniref:UDP-3-O-acylglucosamine N-acyltransferase n=1 Tax=Acetohalobium arabaticum (strain ATCC 49924 / DSM 5501 / Z-7288) TaxID=574087 RepID=D9QTW2_ACEAZ|nr:UDP-3-O-(3-hydroxymyristoyl)glucosamine N-acyltransferase [Acetohalobium arabaticum]ADL13683.1 UDP-3-O-(3-hydroxymyristoyl) glucosamine N-acyltransferase [Acetohalobium arabaticum DSM 5501]
MEVPLKELAELVDGEIIGEVELIISGVGGVENVAKGEITFAQSDEYLTKAESSLAAAVIVADEIESDKTLLKVDNPRLAFAKIAHEFEPELYKTNEIHSTAVIADDVECGSNVSIGPQVTIESGVSIGDNVRIAAGAHIGSQVKIGAETIIHPNVVIMHQTEVGNRVIIHPGAVIGSDGYGFETTSEGHYKVPQLGNVIIEDDVELGANVTIDRGTTGSTVIGRGTKTDNLVHIAHNVRIAADCLLVAQVGIAGSAEIGEGVTLAGKAGVVGHLEVGANTTVAAQSIITNDVPPDSFYSGYPAREHKSEMRIKAARRKLPAMVKELRELKKEVKSLKEEVKEG